MEPYIAAGLALDRKRGEGESFEIDLKVTGMACEGCADSVRTVLGPHHLTVCCILTEDYFGLLVYLLVYLAAGSWGGVHRLGDAESLRCRDVDVPSPGVDCRPANGSLSAGNLRRIFDGIFEMPCAEWCIEVEGPFGRRLQGLFGPSPDISDLLFPTPVLTGPVDRSRISHASWACWAYTPRPLNDGTNRTREERIYP
eukprot:2334148-Pyramimonas_sp.AAC.1